MSSILQSWKSQAPLRARMRHSSRLQHVFYDQMWVAHLPQFLVGNTFCLTLATKAEASMPPTSDSLKKHVLRANYQAAVHSRCLEQFPAIPSPDGHGWKISEGTEIEVVWGDLPPAPSTLLELTHCSCRKTSCVEQQGKGKGRCSCRQHNVPCTDLCKCVECKNSVAVDGDEDDSGEDSDQFESF